MKLGIASSGQINPILKTRGKDDKRITRVAISREVNREPKKVPNAITANKNTKPNVSRSLRCAK